jgi:hypothetical protein
MSLSLYSKATKFSVGDTIKVHQKMLMVAKKEFKPLKSCNFY